jgi:hypothetical protein
MEWGENHEPPRFCIEVNVARGRRKQAVLRLHHGANLKSAVEATVDLNCKTVCYNKLFGDVNIFTIVVSKCFTIFYFPQIHLGWSSPHIMQYHKLRDVKWGWVSIPVQSIYKCIHPPFLEEITDQKRLDR